MSNLGHRAAVWPANVLRVLRPVSSLGHRAAGWPPCRCTPIYDLLLVLRPVSIQSKAGARSSGLRRWASGCSLASPARSCSLHPTGTLGGRRSCSLHPTGTLGPCKKLQLASNAIWPALQEVASCTEHARCAHKVQLCVPVVNSVDRFQLCRRCASHVKIQVFDACRVFSKLGCQLRNSDSKHTCPLVAHVCRSRRETERERERERQDISRENREG